MEYRNEDVRIISCLLIFNQTTTGNPLTEKLEDFPLWVGRLIK